MRTKERLAQDLEKAGAPSKMIEWARNGFYDDYETVIAFPIRQLVADAEAAGLDAIAQDAMNGVYDATEQEGLEWMKSQGFRYLK
jgi:methionine synthase II (cobalamin-independent)